MTQPVTATRPPWLTAALKDVGYHEQPGNDNKFGRALGLNKVPWCDLAVTRWCQVSKHPLPSMQPGMTTGAASVWYSMRYAQANGLWLPSWEAKPGDQIVYGWQGPGSPPAEMHTGLIVRSGAQGTTGHTVEGNRGDQVGRFTFTVGESVVLGCIDLNRLLLGRPKVVVKPKPDPQPRNPHHPAHTGPSPKPAPPPVAPHRPAKPYRLGWFMRRRLVRVAQLADRKHPVTDAADRVILHEASTAISHAQQIKEKP